MASSCSADRGTMIARGGGSREQAFFFFYDLAGFVGSEGATRLRPYESEGANRMQ
jgi:hypothetical protein